MSRTGKPITDETLAKWVGTLKKQTGLLYGSCLIRFLPMLGMSASELLNSAEKDPVGTWHKIKDVSKEFKSPRVRRAACYAARRFLLDSNEDIMLPRTNLKTPDLTKTPTYLTWEDANAICGAASPPYNIAFKIMLSVGWGCGEFLKFNKAATWNAIKARLASAANSDYFKFGFLGRKTNKRPFYSLIPMPILRDAVALEATGKIVLPLSHRARNGNNALPLDETHNETCRRYLGSAFKTALKRAPIVVNQGSPSVHELRDTFLTRAVQVGCSDSAANFSMGHCLDPFGYNKSFRDEAWLWAELKKIHGPAPVTEDRVAKLESKIGEAIIGTESKAEMLLRISKIVESFSRGEGGISKAEGREAKQLSSKLNQFASILANGDELNERGELELMVCEEKARAIIPRLYEKMRARDKSSKFSKYVKKIDLHKTLKGD